MGQNDGFETFESVTQRLISSGNSHRSSRTNSSKNEKFYATKPVHTTIELSLTKLGDLTRLWCQVWYGMPTQSVAKVTGHPCITSPIAKAGIG